MTQKGKHSKTKTTHFSVCLETGTRLFLHTVSMNMVNVARGECRSVCNLIDTKGATTDVKRTHVDIFHDRYTHPSTHTHTHTQLVKRIKYSSTDVQRARPTSSNIFRRQHRTRGVTIGGLDKGTRRSPCSVIIRD